MIKYIVLLRGINISGKNKVSMSRLKELLEGLNYKKVITYHNSGNIILESNIDNRIIIIKSIKKVLKEEFNLDIPLFIITKEELEELLENKPIWWGLNNEEIYDNIIFIIPPVTYKEIYDVLGSPKEDIEKIKCYNNNIFWSYHLKDYKKTNWWSKTANVDIRNSITIRTANTINKILEICNN